jgi:glycosyltransferase involved in cell wall biosynthesis
MSAKNKPPLISVIIPAYNAEKYIDASIQSILKQSHQHFEIIIIDDGSTDNTWKIIQQYGEHDDRIRTYRNDANVGIGGTRNKGIALAKGRYIAWQDADDISLPSRLQQQVSYLEAHKEIGVVGGWLEFFGAHTKLTVRKYEEADAQLRRTIFRYSPIAQPAAMVRKECYDAVGIYNPSYTVSEDLDVWFRIGSMYAFGNVQEVVLRYRQDANSLTRARLKKMEKMTLKLRLTYRHLPGYHPTLGDYAYNIAQLVSLFTIPAKVKIGLFNKLRNTEK